MRVFVAGTATGVGKTWTACRLLEIWRAAGISVSARKPVQSYAFDEPVTDADLLAVAAVVEPDAVCPAHRRYPLAMTPPMAADALGRPHIVLAELVAELGPPRPGIEIVEGVGGPHSPVSHDADNVDLAGALAVDLVVLVADAALGALGGARGGSKAFAGFPLIVYLNRFDAGEELHRRNLAWLQEIDELQVSAEVSQIASRITEQSDSRIRPRRSREPTEVR